MLNQCNFIGRCGADPEVRTLQNGNRVVNLRLAVSERYKDRNGDKQEKTTWVPVVIWNEKLGEIAERYLSKGSMCMVSGAFEVRKWTDQSGAEKYSTEVVLQKFRGELVLLGGGGEKSGGDYGQREAYKSSGGGGALDDEIPFAPCTEA